MIKKTLALFVTPLVMLAATGMAVADKDCGLRPYVGVDAQIRHMPFQKDFGGNVLRKNYHQGNFFAGLRFNEYVGIEAGYEVTKKKSAQRNHPDGELVFGTPPESLDPPYLLGVKESSKASARIHGWNLNLIGFIPVFCKEDNLSLVGSIGVAQLKLKARNMLSTSLTEGSIDDNFSLVGTKNEVRVFHAGFNKRKVVLRLSGGIQHMITDCCGIRALVSWENASKFRVQGINRSGEGVEVIAKLKNSFNYGLGIFTTF